VNLGTTEGGGGGVGDSSYTFIINTTLYYPTCWISNHGLNFKFSSDQTNLFFVTIRYSALQLNHCNEYFVWQPLQTR
jgi:hypothetical protein